MQIHRDSSNGDYEAVALALNAGVVVDVTDDRETTPLMFAVSCPKSNSRTVKLLLQGGADPNAFGGQPCRSVLAHALSLNDVERVRLLLDAGALVADGAGHGFDVLRGAIQGRQDHLLDVVELLLERGAPVHLESEGGDSAASVASERGRFDVVKRLLEAGASANPLEWTPLMRAVALGEPQDVQFQLQRRTDLGKRDSWERTPWLLSVSGGDLQKMKLLLAAGANRDDVGHCGKTALMYSVQNNYSEILKWLIGEKFDLEATNDCGKTALMEAAACNSVESVRLLLEAGADPDKTDREGNKAIGQTDSAEIIRLLAAEGQDLNDTNPETRASMLGLEYEGELLVSPEDFESGHRPRFGAANPQKMEVAFWDAMVRSGATADAAHKLFAADRTFGQGESIWSYHRSGKSITLLPDGRFIEIGGSHEDWYEAHFHIYNEVFVHHPDGRFEIYGYPAEVFPPTDFHSATLVDGSIYIIGCMGHMDRRVIGHTGVYRLDVETLAIEKVETTGKGPGCISMHQGTLVDNEIHVCGGECTEMFILDLDTHEWRREAN